MLTGRRYETEALHGYLPVSTWAFLLVHVNADVEPEFNELFCCGHDATIAGSFSQLV